MIDRNSTFDLENGFREFASSMSGIQQTYTRLLHQIQKQLRGESLPGELLEGMAGNLAHGIRNPLGGIANLVSLMSDEASPEQSEKIIKILEGVERIDEIVESLIFLSRPLTPEPVRCNVSDIVAGAIETTKREHIEPAKIPLFNFEGPGEEWLIQVDPFLIRQALHEILRNAVEAMPNGGSIRTLIVVREKEQNVSIQIEDEGEGLSESDAIKPFFPFYTTRVNGLGLGLPKARMIIEKHHGKISLKNRSHKGVAVTIELPEVQKI